jgi:hypothetical protein
LASESPAPAMRLAAESVFIAAAAPQMFPVPCEIRFGVRMSTVVT